MTITGMKSMKFYKVLWLLSMFFCLKTAHSQITISGPALVNPGDEKDYVINDPQNVLQGYVWSTSGTELSQTFSPESVKIRWNTTGVNFVGLLLMDQMDNITGYVELTVNVNSVVPGTPSQPSVSTNLVGSKTLTRVSPPAGVTWFWQGTNPDGTDTGNSNGTYQATQSDIYYLRARSNDISNPQWSVGSASVNVVVNHTTPVKVAGNDAVLGDHNYVVTSAILKENIYYTSQIATLSSDDRSVSVQYFDGLGRPSQSVGIEAAPDKSHLLQALTYDGFGRKTKDYLPFTTSGTTIYQSDPLGEISGNYTASPQYQFYQGTAKVAQDVAPYAESILESSPLNRILKQGAVGAVWQPIIGSTTDKVVNMGYDNNAANEVRLLKMGGSFPIPVSANDYYAAGELTKQIIEDEEKHKVIEFTDKLGRTILKRVETGNVTDPWADTHYVYDDFGNLRVVLPPEAMKAIGDDDLAAVPAGYTLVTEDLIVTDANYTGGSYMYTEGGSVTLAPDVELTGEVEIVAYGVSLDFLETWAFQYKYDDRNRMVEKKVPGAGWVSMVYDKRDRLVLTQDANQAMKKEWTFTKYDQLNRSIMTGIYTHGTVIDQVAMQAVVDSFYANPANAEFESIGSVVHGYTNNSFPLVGDANDYLTVGYYDTYADLPSEFAFSYVQELGNPMNFSSVKGQIVGNKTRVLGGGNTWLKSVIYYDDHYRILQIQSDNHRGGIDRATTEYDFSGRILETITTHVKAGVTTTVAEEYTYDHASRLTTMTHQVNSDPAVILLKNEYNALGELVDKKLHSIDNGSTFEQSVDYRYNIRGWLTQINDADLTGGDGDYFGMELAYNNNLTGVSSTATFNGNISAAKWSNAGSGNTLLSAYGYSYDAMNRLKSADYQEKDDMAAWADVTRFGLDNLNYDLNGNIESLHRYHTNTITPMDQLGYVYDGNRLTSVTDTGDNLEGFIDGNPNGVDYTYDENGNMISDHNKGITNISYNHLNKPKTVTLTGNRSITYIYDAAGIKLSKITHDDGSFKTTDYMGGFIYEEGVLQQITHSEGRVRRKTSGDMVYDYYLKDHLGNTRLTFTTENEVVTYLATMETDVVDPPLVSEQLDYKVYEENLFLNLPNTRFMDTGAVPANSSNEDHITNDESVRLRGTDPLRQIGPGKLLEVMPGDVIDMEAYYYHQGSYSDDGAVVSGTFLSTLLSLMNGDPRVAGESVAVSGAVNTNSGLVFVGTDGDNTKPRAYLNYIVFDSEFDYLDSDFAQVTNTSNTHLAINKSKTISERGYIYVYVSNESDNNFDVFFDDLRITHTKGKILQEDHYYPFGLSINALSSSAPLSKPNKFKYNGKELQTDFDIGVYDYGSRFYDPQLGRWTVIDKETERGPRFSPYNYTFNNPIKYIDPDGNWPWESKTVKTARRFARATGGSFTKVRKRHRASRGASAIVNIAGTTTFDNVRQSYKKGREKAEGEILRTEDLSTDENIMLSTIEFKDGVNYDGLFAEPDKMLANGAVMQLLLSMEGVATGLLGPAISGSGAAQVDIAGLLNMILKAEGDGKKAKDSSKNERHGDANALEKAQSQLDKLQKQLDNAKTKKEKKRIKKKIQNVTQTAKNNQKGESHHN